MKTRIALVTALIFASAILAPVSLTSSLAHAADPKPSATSRVLQKLYERSKTAQGEKGLTDVIDACDKALGKDATDDDREYSNQLRAWALAKRAALRASNPGSAVAALADYDESLTLDPRPVIFLNRADQHVTMGHWGAAADDYRTVLRLEPKNAAAFRGAAWLLATCPDPNFRDKQLAVDSARKAIELGDANDYLLLETLAAALASAGEFDAAADMQREAIAIADGLTSQGVALGPMPATRLKLYQQAKPYRMAAPSPTSARGKATAPAVNR